jgi:glycosyltransferase involved in cell wall biosynthesis
MKVSIILSVHKNRTTVEQTISSIIQQTFLDWELVICYFDVTKEVKEIIEYWRDLDSRITLHKVTKPGYVHPQKIGLAAIKESNSEYVCIMDSDDIMLPKRIASQVQFLDKNNDFVLVGGQRILIDLKSNVLLNKSGNYPLSHFMIRREMVTYPPIIHPSVMMRRSALCAADGYREAFQHGNDSDLWFRLLDYGKIHNLSQAVIAYRLDNTRPVNQNNEQMWKEILHISNCFKLRRVDEHLKLLEKSPSQWLNEAYSRMNDFKDVTRADRHFYAVSKLDTYTPRYKGINLSWIYMVANSVTWFRRRIKWRIMLPYNFVLFLYYKVRWQNYLFSYLKN